MENIKELSSRLEQIENRNKKVEIDKAWEISWTRKLLLVIFTYLILGLYMMVIGVSPWWLNAIIPTLGFLLSTLSLPYFRKFWERYFYKK